MKLGYFSTIVLVMVALLPCFDCYHNVASYMSEQDSSISAPVRSESSPVVSAVLLECPKGSVSTKDDKVKRTSCEPQLMVNIRVNPSFHIEKVEKFLVLDEVYDPKKRSKAKILAPYLIEISRGEPVMMYPLEFTKNVKCENCEAGTPLRKTAGSKLSTSHNDGKCKSLSPTQESLNRIVSKLANVFPSATKACSPNAKAAINMETNENELPKKRLSKEIITSNKGFSNEKEEDDDEEWVEVKAKNVKNQHKNNDAVVKKRGKGKQNWPFGYFKDFVESRNTNGDHTDDVKLANAGVLPRLAGKLSQNKFAQLGLLMETANGSEYDSCNSNSKTESLNPEQDDPNEFENNLISSLVSDEEKEYFDTAQDSSLDENSQLGDGDAQANDLTCGDGDDPSLETGVHDHLAQYTKMKAINDEPLVRHTKYSRNKKRRKGKSKFRNKMEKLKHEPTSEIKEAQIVPSNLEKSSSGNFKPCECKTKPNFKFRNDDNEISDIDSNDVHGLINNKLDDEHIFSSIKNFERGAPHTDQRNSKNYPMDNLDENSDEYNDFEKGQDIPRIGEEKYVLESRLQKERSYDKDEEPDSLDIEELQEKRQQEGHYKQQRLQRIRERERLREHAREHNQLQGRLKEHDRLQDKEQLQGRQREHEWIQDRERVEPKDELQEHRNDHEWVEDKEQFQGRQREDQWNQDKERIEPKDRLQEHQWQHEWLPDKEQLQDQQQFPNKGQFHEQTIMENSNDLLNEDYGDDGTKHHNHKNNGEEFQANKFDNALHSRDQYIKPSWRNPSYKGYGSQLGKIHKEKSMYIPTGITNSIYPTGNDKNTPHNNEAQFQPSFNPIVSHNKQSALDPFNDKVAFDVRLRSSTNIKAVNLSNIEKDYEDKARVFAPIPNLKPDQMGIIPKNYMPLNFGSTNAFEYIPAPTSIPMDKRLQQMLNKEHSKYLPAKVPYSSVFEDPHLSFKDKLNVIKVIDKYDADKDMMLKKLRQEVEKAVPRPTAYPFAFRPNLQLRDSPNNQKKKRSYLFYDDLEMRDNVEDGDDSYNEIEQPQPQLSSSRHVEPDVQPCNTCGGKGKKPKTDTSVTHTQDTACRCNHDNQACNCPGTRKLRSVSDTWYSVFNMSAPLPFLTTSISVFRKRHNTWWKIVPSITLSSLSGIFANANLSILFSSHVDIFQLEKSLRLQNHKLLIPNEMSPSPQNANNTRFKLSNNIVPNLNELNLNPHAILAVDNDKLQNDIITLMPEEVGAEPNLVPETTKFLCDEIRAAVLHNSVIDQQRPPCDTGLDGQSKLTKRQNSATSPSSNAYGIETIGDLGYFPISMNILERCPNDKNRLCLNLLDDKVPAFNIKLKIPFRENIVLHKNSYKVEIASIITDATTRDALQISVDVINKGFEAHEYVISIGNCPLAYGGATKNSVNKVLSPNIGESVSFLLPFPWETNVKHKKIICDIIVTALSENIVAENSASAQKNITKSKRTVQEHNSKEGKRTVAIRQLNVEQESRCFCVWKCSCHCIQKMETHVDFSVCKKLSYAEEMQAGWLSSGEVPNTENLNIVGATHEKSKLIATPFTGNIGIVNCALLLLLFIFILGLIKAVIGLCFERVNKWGYDYVQAGKPYCESSRFRRYLVNVFFFIMFPFLFWCKCFTPSKEDLLVASTEWQCTVINEKLDCSDEDFMEQDGFTECDDDEEELYARSVGSGTGSRMGGGAEIFLTDKRFLELPLSLNDEVMIEGDDEDDDDDEESTKFVLQALAESREYLRQLNSNPQRHSSTEAFSTYEDLQVEDAQKFVEALKNAQIVYRTFNMPIGNIQNIAPGIKYCVQGYFLPSIGCEYEFVNYNPLVQYRCISPNGFLEIMHPPAILSPREFSRAYENKLDVLTAADLSIYPPADAPCINISMNSSENTQKSPVNQLCLRSVIENRLLAADETSSYAPRPYPFTKLTALEEETELESTEREENSNMQLVGDRDLQIDSITLMEEPNVESQPIEDTLDIVNNINLSIDEAEVEPVEEQTAELTIKPSLTCSLNSDMMIEDFTLELVEDTSTDSIEPTGQ